VDHDDFRSSSFSQNVECVEVAVRDEQVLVRDSRNRGDCVLTFTHREWRAFIAGAKDGEFDLPEPAV
jgi:hypothetical protein